MWKVEELSQREVESLLEAYRRVGFEIVLVDGDLKEDTLEELENQKLKRVIAYRSLLFVFLFNKKQILILC